MEVLGDCPQRVKGSLRVFGSVSRFWLRQLLGKLPKPTN
jgi:hypothetical protein